MEINTHSTDTCTLFVACSADLSHDVSHPPDGCNDFSHGGPSFVHQCRSLPRAFDAGGDQAFDFFGSFGTATCKTANLTCNYSKATALLTCAGFREVEDQLSALRLLEGQAEAQARAVQSARRATQLSDSRYRNGLVSQLELLDARRSELRSQRQSLQVRTAQYTATVGLIRALGGDWKTVPTSDTVAPQSLVVSHQTDIADK